MQMKLGFTLWSKRAIVSPLCAILLTQSAFAVGEDVQEGLPAEASMSLERILKQAGEQGLLELVGDEDVSDHDVAPHEALPPQGIGNVEISCEASKVLSFTDYVDVASFDDVLKAKSDVSVYETAGDIMPVAHSYLSLGMGTEAVASMSGFDTPEANLVSAVGHLVDGTAKPSHVELVQSYKSCDRASELWSLIAGASLDAESSLNTAWKLSGAQLEMLTELPVHLGAIVVAQLGIHAAELGLSEPAESLLSVIEPRFRLPSGPENQSDEHLYFFALVKNLKGDPKAKAIFEFLAQKDGVYQVRALLHLVSNSEEGHDKDSRNDDLLVNLLSVQQQYRGKASARKAGLQIVKKQAAARQYTYAIDLTKREFLPEQKEYVSAVDSIGEQLSNDLSLSDAVRKVTALNGYLYDPKFFSVHNQLGLLQYFAHKAAVDLGFSEIAANIPHEASLTPEKAAELEKDIILADVKASYDKGNYSNVLKLGLPYVEDKRFHVILKRASFKQDAKADSTGLEAVLSEGIEKLEFQAHVAEQRSDWKKAQAALTSLETLKKDDFKDAKTLEIVDYVASSDDKKILSNVKEAEAFQKDLGADISLVKAFLSNG
ncbi:MAG: hypothetical protein ACSHXY_02330 [Alphaproteobacteria bacterium]